MRSRYAAFALGELDYLRRTLDPEHPDAARPADELAREHRAVRSRVRYARLRVLDSDQPAPGEGRVLFHAELYERGKEVSFAELSRFRLHGDAWRYHSGQTWPMRAVDPALGTLRIANVGS